MEWKVQTPPILENYHDVPTITAGPYDYKINDSVNLKEEVVN